MATIVNTPSADNSNNLGTLLGFLILAIVLIVLFIYGLPVIRSAVRGPSINVPEQVDINVNQPAPPSQ